MCVFSNKIFFFNESSTTEIYTLSLHDALPIFPLAPGVGLIGHDGWADAREGDYERSTVMMNDYRLIEERSEEHTSELQSLTNLVCRLLLEKKNTSSCGYTPARCRQKS